LADFIHGNGGLYDDDEKTEIEDTNGDEHMRTEACKRLHEFLHEILVCGGALWTMMLLSGVIVWADSTCTLAKLAPILLIPIGTFQVWRIERMTVLMSKTLINSRPMTGIMLAFKGWTSNYKAATAFSVLDMFSRFTRVAFAARALTCHQAEQHSVQIVKHLKHTFLFFVTGTLKHLSFGQLCALSWAFSAIVVQGWFLLLELLLVWRNIKKAEEWHGDSGIIDVLDDFGALANWAVMKPVEHTFIAAAVGDTLETRNDGRRLFDRMVTITKMELVHIIPDTMVSMTLQVALLEVTFASQTTFERSHAIFAIMISWASAMVTARSMMHKGHVLPGLAALTIILLGAGPVFHVMCLCVGGHLFDPASIPSVQT
jgi:hypothetical protein